MDVLQAHLVRARASGGAFARAVAQPPWGLRLPGTIPLTVHAVIQGRMWLWLDDSRSPLELAPGDVALVRSGPDHFIAHEPNAACLPLEQFQDATETTTATRLVARTSSCAGHTCSQATSAKDYWKPFHLS